MLQYQCSSSYWGLFWFWVKRTIKVWGVHTHNSSPPSLTFEPMRSRLQAQHSTPPRAIPLRFMWRAHTSSGRLPDQELEPGFSRLGALCFTTKQLFPRALSQTYSAVPLPNIRRDWLQYSVPTACSHFTVNSHPYSLISNAHNTHSSVSHYESCLVVLHPWGHFDSVSIGKNRIVLL